MTSRKFEVLEKKRYKMSWGPATVFIHRRLNANGSPVGPAKLNLLPSDQDDYDDEANSQSPNKQSQVYKGASSDYRNVKGSDEEDDEEEGERSTLFYWWWCFYCDPCLQTTRKRRRISKMMASTRATRTRMMR